MKRFKDNTPCAHEEVIPEKFWSDGKNAIILFFLPPEVVICPFLMGILSRTIKVAVCTAPGVWGGQWELCLGRDCRVSPLVFLSRQDYNNARMRGFVDHQEGFKFYMVEIG